MDSRNERASKNISTKAVFVKKKKYELGRYLLIFDKKPRFPEKLKN